MSKIVVGCRPCRWWTSRIYQDHEGFGVCRNCGGRLEKRQPVRRYVRKAGARG